LDNFAINFKKLRESMNYTQDYVAYQLGVPLHVVESWENGTAMPDSNVLPQIANIFCCSIDLLFQNPNEIDTGKTSKTLFDNTPLSRKKVQDVMKWESLGGLINCIVIILGTTGLSIFLLCYESLRPFAAITITALVIGIFVLIYWIKKYKNVRKNKHYDIKEKQNE